MDLLALKRPRGAERQAQGSPTMPLQTLERADVQSGFIGGVASSPAIDSYGHSVRVGAFDQP